MDSALRFVGRYGDATLAVRAALVVAWQVLGWWIVVKCFKKGSAAPALPAGAPDAAAGEVVSWS
jgi:hypothetical protein